MRSLLLSVILGAASLGLFAVTPSQSQAQWFFRRQAAPVYSAYYYPGYTYSYSYGYPGYSYYYPRYSSSYYPGYSNYYYPSYSSYYYSWPGYTSAYNAPGYYGSYWGY